MLYSSINLPLPKTGRLTHLVHLSDIHIRTGDPSKSRYNEYTLVFHNLFNQLKSLKPIINQTTAILITGDIFETKNRIESSGIKLFNMLIYGLAEIAPLYIIQGNHDYRQDQPESPDMISSFLFKNQNQSVAYLHETGCYVADSIGFSVVSVKDTLISGDTFGQVDKLPPFPNNFPPEIKTKIALFHGTIINSTMQNYSCSKNGYPIEWMNGHDMCLLGDVHLQQIHRTNRINNSNSHNWSEDIMPWGYPGSLVQQNFGEPLFGHGFLMWNIYDRIVEQYHVKNQYGLVYLKNHETLGWCCYDKKWIPIDNMIENDNFPNHPLFKIKGKYEAEDIAKLYQMLGSHNNINSFKVFSNMLQTNDDLDDENIDPEQLINTNNFKISDSNSPETWIKYIEEKHTPTKLDKVDWKKWLKNPQTLILPIDDILPEFKDKSLERNNKIIKLANLLQDEINNHEVKIRKSHLKLNFIQWEWILCYMDNNWFNFNNMTKKICTINAQNDSGKSSFLEIVCMGLFGESIPSRYNKEYSGTFICYQKPSSEVAYIELDFSLENHNYRIYRTFEKKNENKLHLIKNQLFILNQNGTYELIKSGVTAIYQWIIENIGDINSFLLSCMLTQNADNDFFSLNKKDQIKLLDKALHLESIQFLDSVLKETTLSYKDIISRTETIHTHTSANTKPFDNDELHQIELEYTDRQFKQKNLEEEYHSIKEIWHQIPNDDLNCDDNTIINNINKYHKSIENIVVNESIDSLLQKKGALNLEFEELSKFYEYDDMENFYVVESNNIEDIHEQIKSLESHSPTKPLCDKNSLENEYQQILLMKHKWKTFSDIDPQTLFENQVELNKLKKSIELFETDFKQIIDNKPNKSNKTLSEYKSWKSTFERLIQNINNNYESVESLKIFCQKNKLISPSIDKLTLETLKNQLIHEKSKLINIKWFDINDDEFNRQFLEIEGKKVILENEKNELDEKINELTGLLENKRSYWNKEDKILKEIRKSPIKEPKTEIYEYRQWYENYKLLQPQYDDFIILENKYDEFFEKLQQIQQSIQLLTQSKEQIEKNILLLKQTEHPYNPHCWACQKQPWKLQLDELTNKYDYIVTDLVSLEKEKSIHIGTIDVEKYKMERDRTTQWIDNYERISSEREYWDEQKSQWEKYNEYANKLFEHEQIVDSIKTEWEIMDDKLKRHRFQKNVIEKNYETNKLLFENMYYCKDNKLKWIQNEIIISQQIKIMNDYQANKKAHDILAEYHIQSKIYVDWQQELNVIEKYNDWEKHKINIENHIANNKKKQESLETFVKQMQLYHEEKRFWQEKELVYDFNRDLLEKWEKHNNHVKFLKAKINRLKSENIETCIKRINDLVDFTSKFNYWKSVQKMKPIYIRKMQLKNQIDEERTKFYELRTKYDIIKTTYQEYLNAIAITDKTSVSLNKLKLIKDGIDHIIETFKNYRSWLYTKIIVPELVKKTNTIAHSITETDTYKLIGTINSQRNECNWFISDGDNQPIIEKAGGFRRFIFGLAIRIAMSSLGATSVKCKQLFIDEGFVSADSDNLEKIPNFIKSLLSIYDGVLLVSHLDIIKECGDVNARIIRSTRKLSQLQFGKKTDEQIINNNLNKLIKLEKKTNDQKINNNKDILIKPLGKKTNDQKINNNIDKLMKPLGKKLVIKCKHPSINVPFEHS